MALRFISIALCYQSLAQLLVNAHLHQQAPFVPELSELGTVGCPDACATLETAFGDKAYYQKLPVGFSETYFAQQQRDVVPACVILPTSAEDVSMALKIITGHQCSFAVKSGGHAMFAGGSNAPKGITLDLRHLNGIQVSDDRLTTFVGTGNRWGNVYKKLEPLNLTVVGGRDSQVGVGGFLLGGGISFISRRHGWGIDNVRNYEIVLANGTISNVNYSSHPDIYFALRGGGNNFGIVTRFDLETYQQGPIWGGHSFYTLKDVPDRKKSMNIRHRFSWNPRWLVEKLSNSMIDVACRFGHCTSTGELLQSLHDFSRSEDHLGNFILSFAFVPIINIYVACLCLIYSEPNPHPPVFNDFERHKAVYTTNQVRNITGITPEIDWMNPIGFRQSWATATFKLSMPFMTKLVDIFISEIDAVKHVSGILPSLIMQVITNEEISAFSKNGGNAIGITDEDGPLLLINNAIRWNYVADDDAVQRAACNILSRAMTLAKEMEVYHRYLYQNYANQSQDVFGGYGPENRERLLQIQKNIDPDGVFSRLQPGYFKL